MFECFSYCRCSGRILYLYFAWLGIVFKRDWNGVFRNDTDSFWSVWNNKIFFLSSVYAILLNYPVRNVYLLQEKGEVDVGMTVSDGVYS